MTGHDRDKPAKAREERLAAALRANLARRKARGRDAAIPDGTAPPEVGAKDD